MSTFAIIGLVLNIGGAVLNIVASRRLQRARGQITRDRAANRAILQEAQGLFAQMREHLVEPDPRDDLEPGDPR